MNAGPTCPFCGGPGARALRARDRNREITRERFAYARCRDCATVFILDPPADLARYYQGDYHRFDLHGEPLWRADPLRPRSAAFRLGLLRAQVPSGSLIEIGAGTGAFALAARDAGFQVTAVEMDERCCRYLRERQGIEAIQTDRPLAALATLPKARAIALWHVLEHLPAPGEVIDALAAQLQPGGVLALGTPNPRSLQFRLLRSRWAHLDAPRHLSLIPAEAVIARAEGQGLRRVWLSTEEPERPEFSLLGWTAALARRPARGGTGRLAGYGALAARRLAAPLEGDGRHGPAYTLVLRKSASEAPA